MRPYLSNMRFVCFGIFLMSNSICWGGMPVVELDHTSMTQKEIEGWKKLKEIDSADVLMDDYVAEFVWTRLWVAALEDEVKARNIPVDPVYVQMRIDENRTSMTEEQYKEMQKANELMFEMKNEFVRSKSGADEFAQKIWNERGPELARLNIATDWQGLRSYLLLLKNDESESFIGSRKRTDWPTREKFVKQVNDPSQNRSVYELQSRIEKLKDDLAGKIIISPEEWAKGRAYFEKNKQKFSNWDSFKNGGLDALLLELKKEYLVDQWVMKKLKRNARFHDPEIKKMVSNWEAKKRPRFREVFGK